MPKFEVLEATHVVANEEGEVVDAYLAPAKPADNKTITFHFAPGGLDDWRAWKKEYKDGKDPHGWWATCACRQWVWHQWSGGRSKKFDTREGPKHECESIAKEDPKEEDE